MNPILYAVDCLVILDNEAELPDESIDLIDLAPPLNSNSNNSLPFKDTWDWPPLEYQDLMAELGCVSEQELA